MFIELRLPLEPFAANLRSRLKLISIPLVEPLPLASAGFELDDTCGKGPVWLDRIKVWDGTVVEQLDPSSLEVRQPIDLFLVAESTLVEANAAASSPCWSRTIEAVFRAQVALEDGAPQMCFSFEELRPGADVPESMVALLNLAIAGSAAVEPECTALDLALLESMFDGNPPPVSAIALALHGSRIALRFDFDVTQFGLGAVETGIAQVHQGQQREAFAAGQFLLDDPARPWTLLAHAFLPRAAARRQLREAIDEQEDTFSLEDGPSTAFKIDYQNVGRVEVKFAGEVIDACICAWDAVDLDVDVKAAIAFSLPQPDHVRGRMTVTFDLSDLEVACCAVTAGFLWLMVGANWVEQDKMSGGEFAGSLIAQIALGPIGIAIPFMAMAHAQGADQFTPGGGWTKVSGDDETDRIVYEREWDGHMPDFGFGAMSMTQLDGVNSGGGAKGLLMSGTLADVRPRSDPLLVVDADPEFVVTFEDPCAQDPGLQAEWHVVLGSKPGQGNEVTTEIQVHDVRIVEGTDEGGYFSPFLHRSGPSVWIAVRLQSINPNYWRSSHAPLLLVVTSGGVRILRIPELPHWSEEQIAQALETNASWQISHCSDWSQSDGFWKGGRFNPRWHIDPESEIGEWQFWEVAVSGLAAGSALQVETLGGATLQVSQAVEAGGAMWRGVLPPGASLSMFEQKSGAPAPPVAAQANLSAPAAPLVFTAAPVERTARAPEPGRPARDRMRRRIDQRGIDLRQHALHPVARLDACWPVCGLQAATVGGRPGVVVADTHGATFWSLVKPDRPQRGARRRLRGVLRAFVWQDQVWLVGSSGIASMAGTLLATACDERIIDADASGRFLFELTARALWSRDRADVPPRWVCDVQAEAMSVHRTSLALADATGVRIHPRRGASIDDALPTVPLRGVSRLLSIHGPGDTYLAIDAEGKSWHISITGSRVFISGHRPPTAPTQLLQRVGQHLVAADLGGRAVQLTRLGRTRLLQRP